MQTIESKLIRGIAPALVTPFDTEDRLALNVVPKLVKHVLDAGVSGVFVCGWTGEPRSLSTDERMRMAKSVVSEVAGHIPVIIHVGATDIQNAVALTRHAVSIGANAVGTTPPLENYSDPTNVFSYYRTIAKAAKNTPFYVYWRADMPASGVTPESFLEEMDRIPNFAGVKFTDTNFYFFQRLVGLSHGKLNALTGPDEMFIAGLAMGSDGAIGSTYNVMPRQFNAIYTDMLAGRVPKALEKQSDANELISALLKCGVISGLKALLRSKDIPVGRVRTSQIYNPLGDLNPGQINRLKEIAEKYNLT